MTGKRAAIVVGTMLLAGAAVYAAAVAGAFALWSSLEAASGWTP